MVKCCFLVNPREDPGLDRVSMSAAGITSTNACSAAQPILVEHTIGSILICNCVCFAGRASPLLVCRTCYDTLNKVS